MSAPTATVTLESPLGRIAIMAQGAQLCGVRIGVAERPQDSDQALMKEAKAQLSAWFSGTLTRFDLPLAPCDTPEGEAARAAMSAIPYGETRTYGDLAALTGSSARAIGQACRTNRFPLIIPCHRVVSADGSAYYSAGEGARTKGWLIDFEISNLPPEQRTRLL